MKFRIPIPGASDGRYDRAGNRAAHIDGKTLLAGGRDIHVTPQGDLAAGKVPFEADAALELPLEVIACHLEPVHLEGPVAKVHIAFHSRKDHFLQAEQGGLQGDQPVDERQLQVPRPGSPLPRKPFEAEPAVYPTPDSASQQLGNPGTVGGIDAAESEIGAARGRWRKNDP